MRRLMASILILIFLMVASSAMANYDLLNLGPTLIVGPFDIPSQ